LTIGVLIKFSCSCEPDQGHQKPR